MNLCECSQHGFCPRHQCQKTEHWFNLCRTREDYFQLWEAGRGPGQNLTPRTPPGLSRRIWNFLGALWRHLRNRRLQVSRNVYRQRVGICEACPSLEPEKQICREKSCGCRVVLKARWASEECPLHKWSREEMHVLDSTERPDEYRQAHAPTDTLAITNH